LLRSWGPEGAASLSVEGNGEDRKEVGSVNEAMWRKAMRRCGGYTGEDGEACVEIAVIGMQ
jgi:hypothetical protein